MGNWGKPVEKREERTERSVPFDLQAERATLGSILLERDAIIAVAGWLPAEYFYLEKHALIYEAMLACYNRREPADLATVAAELRRRGQLELVGGLSMLSELVTEVPTAVHIRILCADRGAHRTPAAVDRGRRADRGNGLRRVE